MCHFIQKLPRTLFYKHQSWNERFNTFEQVKMVHATFLDPHAMTLMVTTVENRRQPQQFVKLSLKQWKRFRACHM